MAEIQLDRVTKRYPDGYEAVKQIDLDVADGEFMILVGPSGCGKSTALRMIAGLEDITEGDLLIGGERVNDLEPRDRDIAMVFLMDEPLSNLDAKLRVQMRTEVSRIQSRLGTTTVYVTHDQTEAMTLGDRVAVMRAGIIQQVDTPGRLYEDPANLFVAGFIGSPAMNFLPARLEGDTIKLPFGDAPITDDLRRRIKGNGAARDVIAGVRPEHFEDAGVEREHPGLRFSAQPSVVESMGSELYAYFDVKTE